MWIAHLYYAADLHALTRYCAYNGTATVLEQLSLTSPTDRKIRLAWKQAKHVALLDPPTDPIQPACIARRPDLCGGAASDPCRDAPPSAAALARAGGGPGA